MGYRCFVWNVSGVINSVKSQRVESYSNQHKSDIAFLHETFLEVQNIFLMETRR